MRQIRLYWKIIETIVCIVAVTIAIFLLTGKNSSNQGHAEQTKPVPRQQQEPQPSPSKAPPQENSSDLTPQVFRNLQDTGIDVTLLKTEQEFRLTFSAPVVFASITLSDAPRQMTMKALDQNGQVVDFDIGDEELLVFGEHITTLLIPGEKEVNGELQFIPQQ